MFFWLNLILLNRYLLSLGLLLVGIFWMYLIVWLLGGGYMGVLYDGLRLLLNGVFVIIGCSGGLYGCWCCLLRLVMG